MPENLGNDYHGYAFLDLYKLNDHFGSENDLKSFISAAHSRDIWVMLDVVGNHVAPVDTSYEMVNPFNSSEYYHSKCQIEDWNNQEEVENCRLANLPDLDQNNAFVRSTMVDWVASLQAKYGFDGLRVDTIPEVHPDFW
jgi:alpha-amylase